MPKSGICCTASSRRGTFSAAIDRTAKLPIYARENVTQVWLIDPLAQTLEVLRRDGGSFRLIGAWRGDAVVHAEPFESLALGLTDLWMA